MDGAGSAFERELLLAALVGWSAVPADGVRRLASASHDCTVLLWDPATGEPVGAPLTGRIFWVLSLAAVPLPSGRTLVACGSVHGMQFWDPRQVSGWATPDGHLAVGYGDQVAVVRLSAGLP